MLCAGVCVLAATSRPDLLDAALLRPGRLDCLIHCGFPTASERGDIINALSRRLRLEGSLDLEGVGQEAEGCTGADLSALLSEAQLAAVHERLEGSSLQDSTGQASLLGLLQHASFACSMNTSAIRQSV